MAPIFDVLIDQFGDDVGYRRRGQALPATIKAYVGPKTTEFGEVLVNAIEVTVRKADASVVLGDVFIVARSGFDPPDDYEVREVVNKSANHFDCHCVRST